VAGGMDACDEPPPSGQTLHQIEGTSGGQVNDKVRAAYHRNALRLSIVP